MDGVDRVDGMDREVLDVLVAPQGALCHPPKSTQSIKSIQSMKSAIAFS